MHEKENTNKEIINKEVTSKEIIEKEIPEKEITEKEIPEKGFTEKLLQYYDFALIHLAWMIKTPAGGKKAGRHLMFGMVECYPKELKAPLLLEEQGVKFKGHRLYYIRVVKPVAEAVKWYRDIRSNGCAVMDWEEPLKQTGDGEGTLFKTINCGRMEDMKPWHSFVLSKKKTGNACPFIADIWGAARTHQIYPVKLDKGVSDFVNYKGVGDWLEAYLGWNISYYPELLGTVNFVLPNPFYRSKSIFMFPKQQGGEKRPDAVKINFQSREGMDTSCLTVVPFEKGHYGMVYGNGQRIEDDICKINLIGEAEKFGMYVMHPEEGLIDYEDFCGFIQSIKLDVMVGCGAKEIKSPDRPGDVERVDMFEKASEVTVGDEGEGLMEAELGERLTEAAIARMRKSESDKYGMRFFYKEHGGAEGYLKDLIKDAKKSVTIIDPYFATKELFHYAMHTAVVGVEVEIITSHMHLKQKSGLDVYEKLGLPKPDVQTEVYSQSENYNSKKCGEICVSVMTGDSPAIHDRFLIVDNEAWFCGGSLNHIGERLSCIIRLPDASGLLDILKQIKREGRIRELKEYISMEEKRAGLNGTQGDDQDSVMLNTAENTVETELEKEEG